MAAEPWFVDAIKDGLKALVSLRLDGTPAIDLLPTTRDSCLSVRAWLKSLFPRQADLFMPINKDLELGNER